MSPCFLSHFFNPEYSELTAFYYVDQKKKVTYFDLIERTRQIQGNLRKLGIEKGDYVLVPFEKEEDLLMSFIAIASLGAKMVPVNPGMTNHELGKISEVIFVKYVLTDSSFLHSHQDALLKMSSLKSILTLDEAEYELPAPLLYLHSKLEELKKREKIKIPDPSQIVTCHFTMKGFDALLGVEHTYQDYLVTLESCHRIFKFIRGRKILSILPVYPVFGFVTNLLYPLMNGCELVLQNKKMSALVKAVQDHKIEHMNVVPVILEKMILEASKSEKRFNFSHLVIVCGGSYVGPELHAKFQTTFGVAPVQGYGLTETLPILSNHPGSSRKGSLGVLMRPEVELKILDARGYEVPYGKAGEICLRGPGVITKYLGDESVQKHLFRSGWLRTGDIGYFDDEGHVIFMGRRLNFTKISGNMVDLKEVEDLALKLHGVKSSRAHVLMEGGREKLALALFVAPDFSVSRKDIFEHFRKHLSHYKIPSQLKIYKNSYHEVTV